MIEELRSEPLFVMRLQVGYDQTQYVGATPDGERAIFPVLGGRFEGARLKGRVLPHGADWVTWRADGAMIIDVRTALETEDGAFIAMRYVGLACGATAEANERFKRREVLPYELTYARTTPQFETADPRYAWLNRVIAVANGARTPDGPIYHVFEVR
jgi:phage terminase large subunit-like protein